MTQYAIVVDLTSGLANLSRTRFDASQVYPNPFSDRATLAFTTPLGGNVKMEVYNLLGSVVSSRTIAAGKTGVNFITLQARDFPAGVYIVSLTDGKSTLTRRMVVKNQ